MSSKPKKSSRSNKEIVNNVEETESEIKPTTSARDEDSESSSEDSTSSEESEDEKTVTAPYSINLVYDIQLSLGNQKIKKKIEKNKHFEEFASKSKFELLQLETLSQPTTFELAQFAARCFADLKDRNDKLPRGWKTLTTASNSKNGYFGVAFLNITKFQVVIAHRGIRNTNEEPYKSHIQTIYEQCHKQVHSAVTFAYKVIKVLEEFNGKIPGRFQLFFTGHGFGGWLAQVAAFSVQYLDKDRGTRNVFLKRDNADDGYLAHTEVFDSIGCEDLLARLVDHFDVRYEGKTIDLNNLDINNFVISPNVVNCFKKQLGKVFLIIKPHSDNFSLIDQYYQDCDSLKLILNYLSSSPDMRIVRDWPVNDKLPVGDECETLILPQFNWLNSSAIPNTKTQAFDYAQHQSQGYYPVRYQTKPFKKDICSLSVFTLPEQRFLKHFHWLRGVPEYFKPSTLFNDILPQDECNYIIEQLQYLEIKSGKLKLQCDAGRNLGQLVSFVKRLLVFYPKLKEKAAKALSFDEVRKFAYKNESIEYSSKLEKITNCFSKNCGLAKVVKKFVSKDFHFLHICTCNDCDTDVVTAMINKTLVKHEQYLVMRLQNVLALNKSVSFKDSLMSQAFGKVLLVFDCNVNPVNSDKDEVEEFFKELIDVLIDPEVKPNVKLIVISEIETDITKYLQRLTKKKLKDTTITADFGGLQWTDLKSEVQEKLSAKTLLIFQGSNERTTLKNLLNENQAIQDIIDNSTIISLIKDRILKIGNQVPDLGNIKDYYVPREFLLDFQVKGAVLLDNKNKQDIIAISGDKIRYDDFERYNLKRDIVQMYGAPNRTKFVQITGIY